MRRLRPLTLGLLLAAALLPAQAAAQVAGLPPLPIPGPSLSSPAPFEGHAATPFPVSGQSVPPQHPFMAPNERSNVHNDAYMTDVYRGSGPLGRDIKVSSTLFFRECGSVTFDAEGRLVTVCVGIDRPVLALLDPKTLAVLATMPLPPRSLGSLLNIFTDFSGGGYFFLDNAARAVVPTTDRHVLVIGEMPGPSFSVAHDYDLSAVVPDGDGIESVLPDWSGRLWFVSRRGIVGTIDRNSGAVKTVGLGGEGISNSFAVDETGGVFIVSDKALYRFDAGPGGEPTVSWREVYPNSGIHKPGQSDTGSGTTPTLMGSRWVSITDNADPMDVVVYDRSRRPSASSRQVCAQPVFGRGAGSTDQSLIGTDTSMVVENNYGYSGPGATEFGGVTTPGLARVDIDVTPSPQSASAAQQIQQTTHRKKRRHRRRRHHHRRHRKRGHGRLLTAPREQIGCHTVWTSNDERAPSVVPKLSLANGLVYTYTKPKRGDNADAWYFTAIDFRTGATVFRRLSGIGLGYNNNYAPVTLGPDGAAYVGVLGGLVRFSDSGA